MSKTEMDNLLRDEILVDCYDRIEQNMSWFYYAEEHLKFPFKADVLLEKVNGTKETKKMKILRLTTDDSNFHEGFDLKVGIDISGYLIEVPLGNLRKIEDVGRNQEIIDVWKYWHTT